MRFGVGLMFIVALVAKAQFGGMGGGGMQMPSLGGTSSAASMGFRPWLAANGYYTRVLGDAPLDGVRRDQFFPSFSGGIGGWKSWENRSLALSYSGSGSRRNYSNDPSADPWQQSHVGTLSYSQQASQRLSFGVSEAVGRTYGGYGSGSAFGTAGVPGLSSSFGPGSSTSGAPDGTFDNVLQNGIVDNEFLNAPVTFTVTSGNVGYLINQRTRVTAFGQAAFVRRAIHSYDERVYSGGASISRQISQRLQIGGGYQRSEMRYPNIFGGVSTDAGSLSFKFNLTPRSSFGGSAGVTLMDSTFVGTVPIDPAIAAIIGSGSVLQVTRTRFLTPTYSGSYSQAFEAGTLTLTAGRGTNAGNGVVYAGVQDSVSAMFSRNFHDRYGVSAMASYYRMSGRVGTLVVNESVQGSGMLSIKLVKMLSFTLQAGLRNVNSGAVATGSINPASNYNRKEAFAGAGLAWSPTDHPFTF